MKTKTLVKIAVPLAIVAAVGVCVVRSLANTFVGFSIEPEEWADYDER